MPISFKDVLRMECLSEARIVAGQKGMDNEVRWITVGEEPDLPDWVFGGELICIPRSDSVLVLIGSPLEDRQSLAGSFHPQIALSRS